MLFEVLMARLDIYCEIETKIENTSKIVFISILYFTPKSIASEVAVIATADK